MEWPHPDSFGLNAMSVECSLSSLDEFFTAAVVVLFVSATAFAAAVVDDDYSFEDEENCNGEPRRLTKTASCLNRELRIGRMYPMVSNWVLCANSGPWRGACQASLEE